MQCIPSALLEDSEYYELQITFRYNNKTNFNRVSIAIHCKSVIWRLRQGYLKNSMEKLQKDTDDLDKAEIKSLQKEKKIMPSGKILNTDGDLVLYRPIYMEGV